MRNPMHISRAPFTAHPTPGHARDLEPRYYNGLWGTLRSPGAAVACSLIGYYSFAGYSNLIAGEGNIGGILIRAFLFASVVAAYAGLVDRTKRYGSALLLPVSIFFAAYLLRLVENVFFSQIRLPGSTEMVFSVFIISGIFTSFMLARVVQDIRDYDFTLILSALNIIFLIGMFLNRDALAGTSTQRLALDRVNPIAMSHLAASFLIFHILFFRQSKYLLIMAIATSPLMLLIMVYARSRGPILAIITSMLIYTLLLKGTRKVWTLIGLAIVALGILWLFDGGEYLNIVRRTFMRTDVDTDESTRAHYLGAVGAWQQFMDDLFFGRYVIESVTGFYPHNIFLEVPMSVGLFGAIPFAIHVGIATRATIGIIRSPSFSLVATFVAIVFIRDGFGAFLSGSVWGSSDFWVGSFLVIAFWYGRDQRQPH